jgi:hypothetical protein
LRTQARRETKSCDINSWATNKSTVTVRLPIVATRGITPADSSLTDATGPVNFEVDSSKHEEKIRRMLLKAMADTAAFRENLNKERSASLSNQETLDQATARGGLAGLVTELAEIQREQQPAQRAAGPAGGWYSRRRSRLCTAQARCERNQAQVTSDKSHRIYSVGWVTCLITPAPIRQRNRHAEHG